MTQSIPLVTFDRLFSRQIKQIERDSESLQPSAMPLAAHTVSTFLSSAAVGTFLMIPANKVSGWSLGRRISGTLMFSAIALISLLFHVFHFMKKEDQVRIETIHSRLKGSLKDDQYAQLKVRGRVFYFEKTGYSEKKPISKTLVDIRDSF